MKNPKIYVIAIIFILIFASVYIVSYNSNRNFYNEYTIFQQQFNDSIKTILLWSPFGVRNWYIVPDNQEYIGQDYFERHSCSYTNCIITANHNFLSSIADFDAIAFHNVDSWKNTNGKPKIRSPLQKYIFFVLESPINTHHDFSEDHNFFNWTMTYRTDSDITYHYGGFMDIELNSIMEPKTNPKWRKYEEDFFDQVLYNLTLGKKKFAAWFVSHCHAQSRRDVLTKKLQQYVNVDVYGSCGTFKCSRDSSSHCNNMLNSDYKFYLSFENSLCDDYITEKLFDQMNFNIIPVVYGGANYSKFVPPHSIINVNDFNTVEELANYLIYLDRNPKEYIKYFWWKKYYKQTAKRNTYCDLCEKLNVPSSKLKSESYSDMGVWWNRGCYDKPKISF